MRPSFLASYPRNSAPVVRGGVGARDIGVQRRRLRREDLRLARSLTV